MSSFTDYIYTNKLTLRDYTWRIYVIILGLGIVVTIIGVYRLTTQDKIQQGLQSDIVSNAVQEVGVLLDEGEVITISGAALTASPNQINLYEDQGSYLGVDTTVSCIDFFNTSKQGVMITTDALCFKDVNDQQIVTRQQINESRSDIDPNSLPGLQSYPTIMSLISADPLIINSDFTQSLQTEFLALRTDSVAIESIHDVAQLVRRPLLIGLIIGWIVASMFVTLMTIILPLIFLTLVSRAMMAITGHPTSFEKEFSKTRLPGTVILMLTWLIPGIGFWVGAVVRLVFPLSFIATHTENSPSSST